MSLLLPQHGLGGSTDLPIPFMYALVGASWALTISFAVLAFAWRDPRLDGERAVAAPGRRPWLAVLGAVVALWWIGTLYAGPDDAGNGGVGALYVYVWVGLVPLALVAGHVWRDLSPWRSIQALVGRLTGRPDGFVRYPDALGYWPAVAGLLAFVWLELASPDAGSVTAVRTWVATYVVVTVVAGIVLGPRWFDRGDPFDVYSAIVARLSPVVRDVEDPAGGGSRRRWGWHNPLRTLPTIPVAPGLVGVLGVLLGSTAYDSFSASPFWQAKSLTGMDRTATLVGFCLVVALLFQLAARATGGISPERRGQMPGLLAHSLVPIVVGYIFAHYLTYLLEKGQTVAFALLDPLDRGWLGDPSVSYVLSTHTSTLAMIKVLCVVVGHVLAVVSAHDKALVLLPRSHRLTGQLAMLVLMVGYTFTGLYLLLSV